MANDLTPSQALIEATRAERERLEQLLAAARRELAETRGRVAELETETSEILRQLKRLADLAGEELPDTVLGKPEEPERIDGREVLRGSKIRRTAVQVLLNQPQPDRIIHYRELHQLILEAGYEIAGGDPPAVLLTQISRSPLVVRGPENGTYRLDPLAPKQLRDRLGALRDMRNALMHGRVERGTQVGDLAERLHKLKVEVARAERQLAEAVETAHELNAPDWFTGAREIADEDDPPMRVAAA